MVSFASMSAEMKKRPLLHQANMSRQENLGNFDI